MQKKKKLAKAKLLTPIQLKMLDTGQPVVVTCQTPSGGSVEVRLQSAVLEGMDPVDAKKGHSKGCWLTHGVYVAVLSDSTENSGDEASSSSSDDDGKTLPLAQMYRVLRGLPGKLRLSSPTGEKFTVTYFNPNAPANRCYETKGLCISLEVTPARGKKKKEKVMSKELSAKELKTLRSGKPLELVFGERILTLQSNSGGQLVELPVVRKK